MSFCSLKLLLTASFAIASSFATSNPKSTSSADISIPIATSKNGSYSGVHNSFYKQDFFFGIPYAQSPIEDLRFRVPQSLNSTWNSTKTATSYPPFCVGYGGDDFSHDLSEDCLYLNVIRPSSPPSLLPVAVWIHGGGLYMGGTNDARYNLTFIVQNSVDMGKPMIGVSIQYRLSAWGFLGGKEVLDDGASNLGFRDQRLALHWIQENIEGFGGDPRKVTIWGESAGAWSVGAQLLAYNGRNDSLFRSAIAQSGGPANSFFPAKLPSSYNSSAYQEVYNALVLNTTCASTLSLGTSLSCLRTLSFTALNSALNTSSSGPFAPTIDKDFISTYPSNQLSRGSFLPVPLLIGTNTDEGTAFASSYAINTDEEWLNFLASTGITPNSKAESIISALYPDIPALGIYIL